MDPIRFTSEEVHDLLNAELRKRHPEWVGCQTEIASIVTGDDEFIGIDVFLDGVDGPLRQVLP